MAGTRLRGVTALALGMLAVSGTHAGAATINVTTNADGFLGGVCTLREAIDAAVDNASGATGCTAGSPAPTRDEIVLTQVGPYMLTNPTTNEVNNADGDLDVAGGGPITIRSEGNLPRTIDTLQADRAFELVDGASDLTLENVTVGGGDVTALGLGLGGVIFTDNEGARLTLREATVSGGTAVAGGGISLDADNTQATLTDSEVSFNQARIGGGIRMRFAATAEVRRSRIALNDAVSAVGGSDAVGGGIQMGNAGSMTVVDSVVADNDATHSVDAADSDAAGGGIMADGPITIRGSTISGNTASVANATSEAFGGGLTLPELNTSESVIANSTIFGNEGFVGAGISGDGSQGTVEIVHTTFAGNDASEFSAGDHIDTTGAGILSVTIRGSILTSSLNTNACETDNPSDISSDGFNVASSNDPECNFGSTDLVGGGVNLGLASGTPKDHGGPTPTIALTSASDAIDFVLPGPCDVAGGTDQRGVERPFGAGCDAGAYERATCSGTLVGASAILGTPGANTLTGTPGADLILGQGGNDVMRGLGGGDKLCGGAGNDKGNGAAGKDLILGDRGADRLAGGGGRDRLVGSVGRDRLRGNRGRDRLLGGPGRDRLRGGPGKDRLRGGPGKDDQKQ